MLHDNCWQSCSRPVWVGARYHGGCRDDFEPHKFLGTVRVPSIEWMLQHQPRTADLITPGHQRHPKDFVTFMLSHRCMGETARK